MPDASPSFNQRQFRDAMGQFCTGVAVVTGDCPDGPAGFSVQSFVSVSLSPPLIAVCPALGGKSWQRIRSTGRFGVNILAGDQQGLCARFATSTGDKFRGLDWTPSDRGMPVLESVLGFVDCDLEAEHEVGDHYLVIGRVRDLQVLRTECAPLLFFRGHFGTFDST